MELPSGFLDELAALGPVADGLAEALTGTEPSVSIRLNAAKPVAVPEGSTPIPWAERGFYLAERPRFTLDPAFHQGRYYVQDASSMFIGYVLRSLPLEGAVRYLDACAAPGGKTTAAIDELPEGSVVVANEYVPARAAILRENVIKHGSPLTVVTRADTADLARALPEAFDVVGADVPCSGEGMMRKDPEAVAQWSRGLVAESAERQREILSNLWKTLRPGGYLVYSTCTFNRDENEEIIDWLTENYGAEPVEISIESLPGIERGIGTDNPCYRFMPHRCKGEGLFMAVVRKPGSPRPPKKEKPLKKKPQVAEAAKWIEGEYLIEQTDDRVSAVAPELKPLLSALAKKKVDVIYDGINLATVKGRDLLPSQALAMSRALRPDAFPRVDVDRETALEYLRRQAVTLPEGTPRGYVLLTFEGLPLGFVKNLGNRSNNLYPSKWKIIH